MLCTGLGKSPSEVKGMRMRDANRLLKYWGDCPPQHVAVVQLRNIVITAFGGTPPEPNGSRKLTTADEWSALAVSLGK